MKKLIFTVSSLLLLATNSFAKVYDCSEVIEGDKKLKTLKIEIKKLKNNIITMEYDEKYSSQSTFEFYQFIKKSNGLTRFIERGSTEKKGDLVILTLDQRIGPSLEPAWGTHSKVFKLNTKDNTLVHETKSVYFQSGPFREDTERKVFTSSCKEVL